MKKNFSDSFLKQHDNLHHKTIIITTFNDGERNNILAIDVGV